MSADPSEEQFIALLGKYAGHRGRLLDKVTAPKIAGHPLFVQLCCGVTLIAVLVSVFAQIGSVTLFSLHPLFMGLGCLLFMAEGVLVYRNRVLVNVFSPIMQHTKKRKARSLHQFLHTAAAIFVLLGYIAIVSNKVVNGKTVFPLTIHAWLGTICMLYIIAQVAVGLRKLDALSSYPERRVARYHGEAGLLLFDLSMLTTLLGLLSFLEFSFKHLLVELMVVGFWFVVQAYMRMKSPQSQAAKDPPSSRQGILVADETGEGKPGEMIV